MAKNYYAILGILPDATSEDIRGAYRQRAKELHPDHYGANSRPFLEVQEAYEVLGNPRHRRDYDRSRHSGNRRPASPRPWAEPLKPSPNRPEPFDASGGHPLPGRRRDPAGARFPGLSGRRPELGLEISLTPEEARRGGRFELSLPAAVPCPACGGRGFPLWGPCPLCLGSGSITENLPVTVEFAPGVADRYETTVPLTGCGIRDACLTLFFRIEGSDPAAG